MIKIVIAKAQESPFLFCPHKSMQLGFGVSILLPSGLRIPQLYMLYHYQGLRKFVPSFVSVAAHPKLSVENLNFWCDCLLSKLVYFVCTLQDLTFLIECKISIQNVTIDFMNNFCASLLLLSSICSMLCVYYFLYSIPCNNPPTPFESAQ